MSDTCAPFCESLSAIAFPSSVTGIWSTAFQNCSSLNGITVDSANTTYKSDGNCVIRIVDNCLVLGGNSTIIPNYVTKIGENAFYNRDNLTNIVIPANVTIISNDAFYDCSNLSSLVFASNSQLNTVGSYAFYNCQKLTSVTIPDSVFVIDFGAFKNCTSLGTVQMPSNGILEHIDEQAFANTNIAYIVLPKTIRTVGLSVFKDCGNLLYVFIDGKFEDGDYFTYIEGSEEFSQLLPMFDGCNNLKAIFVSSAEDWGHYGNLWEDLSSKMIILESQNTAVFSTHMCLLFDTGKFTEIYFIDSDNLEDYVAALSFYAESGYTLIFYLPNEEYLAYVPQGIEDYNYVIIFEESNTIYGSMHEPIPN